MLASPKRLWRRAGTAAILLCPLLYVSWLLATRGIGVENASLLVRTGDYYWRFGPPLELTIQVLAAGLVLLTLAGPTRRGSLPVRPKLHTSWIGLSLLVLACAYQVVPLETENPWARVLLYPPLLLGVWLICRAEHERALLTKTWKAVLPLLLGRGAPLLFCLAGIACAAFSASLIYGWHTAIIDAHSQVLQARHLLAGTWKLAMTPEMRAVVNLPNYTWVVPAYSQYPPGHILLLMPVLALGLPANALNVLAGGVTVGLTCVLARTIGGRTAGAAAALLLLFSPWVQPVSGGVMNHATTACLLLVAAISILFAFRQRTPHGKAFAALAGFALGWAFGTRPLTAVAHMAGWIAAGLVAASHPAHRKVLRSHVAWLLVPFVLVVALVAFYNWKMSGSPLTFGYTVADKELNSLGFKYEGIYRYTPLMAMHRTAANLLSLNQLLFGWPTGSLVLLLVWWVQGRATRAEWILAGLVVLQCSAYAVYHFHQLFLGPRFWYETAPLLSVLAGIAFSRGAARFSSRRRGLLWSAFLVLSLSGSAWGFRKWAGEFSSSQGANLAAFMQQLQPYDVPTVLVIPRPYLDAGGEYIWAGGGGRAPLWFVPAEVESRARQLPELKNYRWVRMNEAETEATTSPLLL